MVCLNVAVITLHLLYFTLPYVSVVRRQTLLAASERNIILSYYIIVTLSDKRCSVFVFSFIDT